MIVTPIGFVFVALFIALLIGGRSTFVWAIAVSMFFQDSAMLVVGTVGLSPYSVALIVALGLQIVFVVRRRRIDRPGEARLTFLPSGSRSGAWLRRGLLVLLVYGAVISAIGPAVFGGVLVMPSQGSSDYLVDRLPHLGYSLSNAAQIVYLLLNAVLVWFIATLPRVPRAPFFAAMALSTTGVLVALVLTTVGVRWPYEVFDNSPRNYYAVLANDPRLRAQFSEPSHLAWFLCLALAYAAALLTLRGAWRRAAAATIIAIAVVVFLENPSTTSILTLGLLIPAALVVLAIHHRHVLGTRRGRIGLAVGAVAAAGLIAVLWVPLSELLGPMLLGKVGSASQYSRGKQDLNALSLFGQSFGLGVGLGSNRSSSLATMLLSDVGVVGTVAYYVVIVSSIVILFKRGSTAEGWALTALAVACAISVADFVSPATWFLVGVAAQLSRPATNFGGAHRLPVVPRLLTASTGVRR